MRAVALLLAGFVPLLAFGACSSNDSTSSGGDGGGAGDGATIDGAGDDASGAGDGAQGDDGGSSEASADATGDGHDAACVPPGPPLVVFLNRDGGTYNPGTDDSGANYSSVLQTTDVVPAWSVSNTDWATLVSCVAAKFAPFNVSVTDVDPGTASHVEVVFAPGGSGPLANTDAVAPFTCKVVPNAVTFFSTTDANINVLYGCAGAANTVGFTLGLEAEATCSDAMTFQSNSCPTAGFTNTALPCGVSTPTSCTCQGGSTQNSYTRLLAAVGPACL